MVHLEKNGLKKSVLLLAFFFYIGFSGAAEAIEMSLPTSIHEILKPGQIEKVKVSNALKNIQQDRAQDVFKDQGVSNALAMQKMIGMRLGRIMSSKRRVQIEGLSPPLQTIRLDAGAKIRAALAPGMMTKNK